MLKGEKAIRYVEGGHRLSKAVKHMTWLASASAAWLTLFPCGLAFADPTPADPNPPLTESNTKYDKKGDNAGETIRGGRLSISGIDTSKIWYVIAN